MYAYDFARLYEAINIATSESLQFLFPEVTTFGNGILLWESILANIFGTTYKDALDAADKLRRWAIDPSKHIHHDLHHFVLLVKRINKTSKSILPETSILGIINEATSKDPREELRMISTYSSWNNQLLEEFMLVLHKLPHAGPFNSRNVKMNEFKTTNIEYCNRFQVGKCTFGERCNFKQKIDPEFKPREQIIDDEKKKDFTKDKKKKLPNKSTKEF